MSLISFPTVDTLIVTFAGHDTEVNLEARTDTFASDTPEGMALITGASQGAGSATPANNARCFNVPPGLWQISALAYEYQTIGTTALLLGITTAVAATMINDPTNGTDVVDDLRTNGGTRQQDFLIALDTTGPGKGYLTGASNPLFKDASSVLPQGFLTAQKILEWPSSVGVTAAGNGGNSVCVGLIVHLILSRTSGNGSVKPS